MKPSVHHFMQQTLFRQEYKVNDIDKYLQSEDYKKLSRTIHGKINLHAKTKFAWLPTVLTNSKIIWFKNYVERQLTYLNVRGKEKIAVEDYMLLKLKDTAQ
tara:strand:+ start:7446 stop:7748 length:303 start_codon:yes stop_codon:yes gene_type:complete